MAGLCLSCSEVKQEVNLPDNCQKCINNVRRQFSHDLLYSDILNIESEGKVLHSASFLAATVELTHEAGL